MPSDPAPLSDLHAVVEALAEASTALTDMPLGRREFPSRTAVAALVEDLRALLFPGYFGASELTVETLRYHLGARMDRVLHGLADQIQRGLMASDPACEGCEDTALAMARAFLARLPEVRRLLATDVQAGYDGDPAATGLDEIIFCYPGLYAITVIAWPTSCCTAGRAHPAPHDLGAGAQPHRHRHPPRRHDRRVVLHRPWHGRGDRRDDHVSARTCASTRA